jgi:hypothetical protein
VKTLAWLLTAAAVLIGADVFVASSNGGSPDTATMDDRPVTLHGGEGWPTPDPQ